MSQASAWRLQIEFAQLVRSGARWTPQAFVAATSWRISDGPVLLDRWHLHILVRAAGQSRGAVLLAGYRRLRFLLASKPPMRLLLPQDIAPRFAWLPEPKLGMRRTAARSNPLLRLLQLLLRAMMHRLFTPFDARRTGGLASANERRALRMLPSGALTWRMVSYLEPVAIYPLAAHFNLYGDRLVGPRASCHCHT